MDVLLGLLTVGLGVLAFYLDRRTASKKDRLLRDLQAADRKIEGDYRQARRAMNDAANHSWRNLADGDPHG